MRSIDSKTSEFSSWTQRLFFWSSRPCVSFSTVFQHNSFQGRRTPNLHQEFAPKILKTLMGARAIWMEEAWFGGAITRRVTRHHPVVTQCARLQLRTRECNKDCKRCWDNCDFSSESLAPCQDGGSAVSPIYISLRRWSISVKRNIEWHR